MDTTRAGMKLTSALTRTLSKDARRIKQIAYLSRNLDEDAFVQFEDGDWRVQKDEILERICVYPGTDWMEARFKVARFQDDNLAMGIEIEKIQPMTEPNYISVLNAEPGQIVHLAVDAQEFQGATDHVILARTFRSRHPQLIQKGQEIETGMRYAIYQPEDFLPVKIRRWSE